MNTLNYLHQNTIEEECTANTVKTKPLWTQSP